MAEVAIVPGIGGEKQALAGTEKCRKKWACV